MSVSTNSLGIALKWNGILHLSQNKKEKENKEGGRTNQEAC